MSEKKNTSDNPEGYTPDFELPRHDAIHEANWAEYQAKGFVPTIVDLDSAQAYYGTEHVYTGDKYDYEAGRPLRHKPGQSVYVDPEGQRIWEQRLREHQERMRQHGTHPPAGGPAAN